MPVPPLSLRRVLGRMLSWNEMDDNFDRFEQRTAALIDTTAPAAQAAANAALPRTGGTMTGVIDYAAAQPRLVQTATAIATSGTTVAFTGIPSWATRVSLAFIAVSVAPAGAAGPLILRLGSSAGIESTGYSGCAATINGTTAATCSHNPADAAARGINLIGVATSYGSGADTVLSGEVIISLVDPSTNTWASRGVMAFTNFPQVSMTAGTKSLTGVLDRLQLACSTGNSFEGGRLSALYEG